MFRESISTRAGDSGDAWGAAGEFVKRTCSCYFWIVNLPKYSVYLQCICS